MTGAALCVAIERCITRRGNLLKWINNRDTNAGAAFGTYAFG